MRAIANFPAPKNVTDLRSFFGLANQLGGFSTRVAKALGPHRPMLRPKSAFLWEEPQRLAFQAARVALSEVPVRQYFDPSLPVRLLTDAAHTRGLGYALM